MKTSTKILIGLGLILVGAIYMNQDYFSERLIENVPFVAEAVLKHGNAQQANVQQGELWETNWDKRSIELDELIPGGPPRDGIPPIDHPEFVTIEAAQAWLDDREPVLVFSHEGEARAYPIQILMWHEIVNDTLNEIPITVTYCPLCNAAIVFDRRLDGDVLTFGTSGMLRKSDLVMWDRQTESLWQQLTGEAIVGDLTGATLTMLPSKMISFQSFYEAHPNGEVLSRETGTSKNYGQNPYAGYDEERKPFLYYEDIDDRLEPMDRVVAFMRGDGLAYSYDYLKEHRVVNLEMNGQPTVIFWAPGVASAMHAAQISEGRDVGAVGVFNSVLDGEKRTFSFNEEGEIIDHETESTWSHTGRALEGPLAGNELQPVLHFNHFWFAWQAFYPDTELVG